MGIPECPDGHERSGEGCVASTPACPEGFVARGEACESACSEGRSIGPETQGNCCWAGQVWAVLESSCVGRPTECPPGRVADARGCAPDADAPSGSAAQEARASEARAAPSNTAQTVSTATAPAQASSAVAPPEHDPNRSRVGLGLTAGTGGWGYGIVARADIGLVTLPGPFPHGLSLGIDAAATIDVGTDAVAIHQFVPTVGALAVWRAVFGPVETAVRVGLALAFPYAWSDQAPWRLDVWFRGSVGVAATLHVDEFRPFVALDSYFGAGESFVLSLGVVVQ